MLVNRSIPHTNSIFDMQYDLENNLVHGEKIPSDEQFKLATYALSFSKRIIFEQVLNRMPTHAEDYLSPLLEKTWIDHINWNNYVFISKLDAPIENENNFKEVILKLLLHILNFSKIFVDLKINMDSAMVQDYTRNFRITKRIEVDYKNAALFLAERSNLSTECKYKIACYFCLESQACELVKKLSLEFINQFIESSSKVSQLLKLWYFCIEKKPTSFNKILFKLKAYKKETNEEYLMVWAIRKKNEFAVQYIFEKYFRDSCNYKLFKIIKYALHYHDQCMLTNIKFYLISKIRSDDLIKQLCIEDGYEILSDIINDLRWRDYFLQTSKNVLKYIDKMNFICTLKTLVRCWITNQSERNLYNLYLNRFISKFEVSINKKLFHSDNIRILNLILELQERKNLNALLEVGGIVDIANVFCNGIMRGIGTEFILVKKTQTFKKFIEDHLIEEEAKRCKINFFTSTYFKICSTLIVKERFQELDEYFEIFCESSIIIHSKGEIPYFHRGNIIGRVFLTCKKGTKVQDKVDRVLEWCFSEDPNQINEYKTRLFTPNEELCISSLKSFLIVFKRYKDTKKKADVEQLFRWAHPFDKHYKIINRNYEIIYDPTGRTNGN